MQSRIALVAIALLGSLWINSAQAADLNAAKSPQARRILKFDVSELATRFVFDETPLDANGKPAYGNEFITEGVIYEQGVLTGTNGVIVEVDEHGKKIARPEFPDKVIGRWTCRGWHVGEGATTVTGPWVATSQIYDFAVTPGQAMFTSDGLELVDIGVAIERAVTGGTGPYRRMRGTAIQTMLGFNASEGVNLRFEIKP